MGSRSKPASKGLSKAGCAMHLCRACGGCVSAGGGLSSSCSNWPIRDWIDGPLLLPPPQSSYGVTICSLVNIMFEKLHPPFCSVPLVQVATLYLSALADTSFDVGELVRPLSYWSPDLPRVEIIYRKCDGAVIRSSSALELLGCCLVGTSSQRSLSV